MKEIEESVRASRTQCLGCVGKKVLGEYMETQNQDHDLNERTRAAIRVIAGAEVEAGARLYAQLDEEMPGDLSMRLERERVVACCRIGGAQTTTIEVRAA